MLCSGMASSRPRTRRIICILPAVPPAPAAPALVVEELLLEQRMIVRVGKVEEILPVKISLRDRKSEAKTNKKTYGINWFVLVFFFAFLFFAAIHVSGTII